MFDSNMFADIILPLPLKQLFTYRIPSEMNNNCTIGKRVVVMFGRKKFYTGIIKFIHKNKPTDYELKDIVSVLDDNPIITNIQFKFWDWLSNYYMCSQGEIMNAALPSGLKLESETKIIYNDIDESQDFKFNIKEESLIYALKTHKILSINKVASILNQKTFVNHIKSLLDKGIIRVEEETKNKYKPKLIAYYTLSKEFEKEEKLKELFKKLEKAPKQLKILVNYLTKTKFKITELLANDILDGIKVNSSILNTMVKKNIFVKEKKEISRFKNYDEKILEPKILSETQSKAYNDINNKFITKDTVLLHGVTSSGKTEIYIHLIKDYLDKGKQILYLLPEIALTAQIINRLKFIFGDLVCVYHSKFNDSERVEIWNSVNSLTSKKQHDYRIILGARSSIFLPFDNLGLIIVDEEHENSYKQQSPSPRYNARDSAIVLSKLHNAKILLATATPSIESYHNVLKGKYALVELQNRYKNIKLPEIKIANIREAYRKKQMKSHFSPTLLQNIKAALDNNEQIILFQNRRGFSPFVECKTCGWIPKCEYCDVSLTYHKYTNELVCHYCGYTVSNFNKCKACSDIAMQTKGFGTEKIEDEITIFFPDIVVKRMDYDTTRNKNSYYKIIKDFEDKKIDILVGTQMVSKGLDFDNVSLVGILNADTLLNYPDFRAYERSYQLMTQVSGRAGRKNKQGKVIIQTSDPKNRIINYVLNNQYNKMLESELSERQKYKYPPFYRLISITLKHKNKQIVDDSSKLMAEKLRILFGSRVLGPEYPIINRIQNKYLKKILLKIEKNKSTTKAKEILDKIFDEIKIIKEYRYVTIVCDVDPL